MVGAGSPQVSRRLVAALADLRRVALPERIEVLDEQLELLRAATVEAMTTIGMSAKRSIPTAKGSAPPRLSVPSDTDRLELGDIGPGAQLVQA